MDEDTSNDMMWEDQENFRAGAGHSIKEIVLKRYEMCLVEGSKEMTRGGVIRRILNGQVIDLPKPDQIQLFTNSVQMLLISLKAHAEQHNDFMRPYFLKYYKGLRDLDSQREERRKMRAQNVHPGRSFSSYERMASVESQMTSIDAELNAWYDNRYLKIHQDMLCGLSLLLNKINYFEEFDLAWEVGATSPTLPEQRDTLNEEAVLRDQ